MGTIRLDRYIAENTAYSRSEAKRLVSAGRVLVEGKLSRDSKLKITPGQQVVLDQIQIHQLGHLYLVLNKPTGYVSATSDSAHPTLLDLIQDKRNFSGDKNLRSIIQQAPLQIVGRLDKDTSGLILLTTDGDWNHRLSSPNSGCSKTYEARLAEPIDHKIVKSFAEGIMLRSETKLTKPAQLDILEPTLVQLTISEGRYHQVKRMFAAIGNKVTQLKRIKIGSMALDSTLNEGEYRCLYENELAVLNDLKKARNKVHND